MDLLKRPSTYQEPACGRHKQADKTWGRGGKPLYKTFNINITCINFYIQR